MTRWAWLFVAVVAAAGGYLVALRQGQTATMKALQTEAAGNLTQRIETLSLLRVGDVSAAITGLEREADQLVVSIAANAHANRGALASAKAYRKIVPAPAPHEKELAAAFASVPDLALDQCSSALRNLIERDSGRSRQP